MGDLVEAQMGMLATQRELLKTQDRLQSELQAAGRSVQSLLPSATEEVLL